MALKKEDFYFVQECDRVISRNFGAEKIDFVVQMTPNEAFFGIQSAFVSQLWKLWFEIRFLCKNVEIPPHFVVRRACTPSS